MPKKESGTKTPPAPKPKATKPAEKKPAAAKSGAAKGPASSAPARTPVKPASKPAAGRGSIVQEPVGELAPSLVDTGIGFLLRIQRFAWDFAGLLLLAAALMTLLALVLPDLAGGALNVWAEVLRHWLGQGSYWLVLILAAAGVRLLRRRHVPPPRPVRWGRVVALEAAAFAWMALLTVNGGSSLARAEAGLDGGLVGWGLAELVNSVLAPFGMDGRWYGLAIWGSLFLLCLALSLGLLERLAAWALRVEAGAQPAVTWGDAQGAINAPILSEAPLQADATIKPSEEARRKKPILPPEFRKNFRIQPEATASSTAAQAAPPRDDRLPPLDLLSNEQSNRPDERHINLTAGLIEKTLSEFGIPAKVVGFRVGPTVTQFAVEPGFVEKEKSGTDEIARMKIRVAQISGLQRDLTLALAASRLRIEAPVPGRPYVGIEVPNSRSTVVRLRPLIESEAFYKLGAPLAVGLGRDVSGQPVVADLTKMPHLLIAGTTGSGKSVAIAALTVCLVMNNTPEDLRLVMVDPKMVELVRFNGLPHLLGKVETDVERILGVLRWTVAEMDRRYKLLEATRSRNIDTYNKRLRKRKGEESLPRIVVMVDELADLMMSAPDQTEHNLVRLAQMARAVGIHLVVATQRPSVDVVTGLIKANFPARISFAVASSIDSRVILDTQGAESLLGRGDMLFLPPEASAPIRSQGAMVSDQEVEKVIAFWQKAAPPEEREASTTPWDAMMEQEAVLADRDDLVERAVDLVRREQKASASMLQRRLRIGYPRAARLIDELEELGVIGPGTSGREREVLIGPEDGSSGEAEEDY